MKTFSKIIFLTLAAGFLTACPFMTRDDIQQQDEQRQLKDQVSSIQKAHADSEEQYNDVEGDLRTMGGRLDGLDHNQQVAQQQSAKDIDDLKKLVAAQNDKITALEQHMDATEARMTSAIQAMAAAPPTAPAHSDAPTGKDSTKKSEHPAWSEAESLFAKKDFKQAILKYQAYKDKNPKGTKNAEATYKMGVCFAELGRKKEAREFYQATLDNYPGTASAKKAKFRLTQLKSVN